MKNLLSADNLRAGASPRAGSMIPQTAGKSTAAAGTFWEVLLAFRPVQQYTMGNEDLLRGGQGRTEQKEGKE